jgi:hypothetical protein
MNADLGSHMFYFDVMGLTFVECVWGEQGFQFSKSSLPGGSWYFKMQGDWLVSRESLLGWKGQVALAC